MDVEVNPAAARRRQVLLVEDDDGVRRSLHLLLHGRGFDVRSYATITTLIDDAGAAGTADWLIADYRLPDGDGLGALRALRRTGWRGQAVLITAFATDLVRQAAVAAGYDAVLDKPLREYELAGVLS